MQEVFKFVCRHYEAILSVLTLIISVVVLILRKKPVSSLEYDILSFVIKGIDFTEYFCDKKGEEKLKFCVSQVKYWLKLKYPNLDITRYDSYIVNCIEAILSTPQKKEDL